MYVYVCILCMHMCGHVCVRMGLYECTLLGVHMLCTQIPYNCRYSWWVYYSILGIAGNLPNLLPPKLISLFITTVHNNKVTFSRHIDFLRNALCCYYVYDCPLSLD